MLFLCSGGWSIPRNSILHFWPCSNPRRPRRKRGVDSCMACSNHRWIWPILPRCQSSPGKVCFLYHNQRDRNRARGLSLGGHRLSSRHNSRHRPRRREYIRQRSCRGVFGLTWRRWCRGGEDFFRRFGLLRRGCSCCRRTCRPSWCCNWARRWLGRWALFWWVWGWTTRGSWQRLSAAARWVPMWWPSLIYLLIIIVSKKLLRTNISPNTFRKTPGTIQLDSLQTNIW